MPDHADSLVEHPNKSAYCILI